MIRDYSPFSPGQPVKRELFIGRQKEIEYLLQKINSTASGRLNVAFLTGERGIGKSSLASYVRFLAEKKYDIIGLHAFLGGAGNVKYMIGSIFDHFVNEMNDKPWFSKIKNFFDDRISSVDLFGASLKFKATDDELKHLADHFAPALRKLYEPISDEKKGIFIILDEINGLTKSIEFANWLKSFVDSVATSREPLPIFLLLVGIEERRQELTSSHNSLARVFDLVNIKAWSDEETEDFYNKAFSKVGISIDDKALKVLSGYAGGLPVLAHEIGDAVFNIDDDNHINTEDASTSLIMAADIVGRKHLELQVFKSIKSQKYRSILRKLASNYGPFQRGENVRLLNREERRVFDNFLKRMLDLGVLVRDPELKPGVYQFRNLLHQLYYRIEERLKKSN